jgi:hypothetical protein
MDELYIKAPCGESIHYRSHHKTYCPKCIEMSGIKPCCETFQKAQESGTDNETYGPLVISYKRKAQIGDYEALPPINYCPWCGDEKT